MPKNTPKNYTAFVLEGFCINVTPTVTVPSVLNFKFLYNVEMEGNINVH